MDIDKILSLEDMDSVVGGSSLGPDHVLDDHQTAVVADYLIQTYVKNGAGPRDVNSFRAWVEDSDVIDLFFRNYNFAITKDQFFQLCLDRFK